MFGTATSTLIRGTAAPRALALAALAALAALLGAGCGSGLQATTPPIGGELEFISATPSLALPTGVANTPYGFGFLTNVGEGGILAIAPVTFGLYNGSTLPPGLTFSASGVLSGSPSQAGYYNVELTAVDSSSPPLTAVGNYTFAVRLPGTLLTQVGHSDLGAHGQNGDVTVATSTALQEPYAYVGTLGRANECPATGVKVVDLSQITNPTLIASIGGVAGSSQAAARIATGVSSPDFHNGAAGDLMAITLQPCNPNSVTAAEAGVQFYDITDPTHPTPLGFWSSGVQGVNDVAFVPVPGPTVNGVVNHALDKIYALVSVPGSETSGTGLGDLRVLDVTAPSLPRQIGNWGVLQALDVLAADVETGYDPAVFLSSISLSQDRTTAFLAYWDEGVVVLNVADPTAVTAGNSNIILSHVTYPVTATATTTTPAEPEGNTYKALPVAGDTGLLVTDQICASATGPSPSNAALTIPLNPAVALVCGSQNDVPLSATQGWGFLRTYALPTFAQPNIQSFMITPQDQSDPAPDNGIYTAAGLAWNGNTQFPHGYVAWYSNGIVDVDLSSLNPPTLLAAWVPPDTADPNGNNPAVDNPAKALIDGVAAYNLSGQPYILGSDINSGLWVVKETPAPALTILTTTLPEGNVGVPYTASLSGANGSLGSGELHWGTGGTNPLPAGLSLDNNGNITGTPLVSGTTAVTFTADDGLGNSTSQTINMVINDNFALIPVQTQVLTQNEPYALAIGAVNGTTPLNFSVVSGTLPSGVLLTASTGVIAGTPTGLSTTNVTLQAVDSSTPPLTATLPVTLEVEPLTIFTTTLPDPVQGVQYNQMVTMTNGTGPFNPVVTTGTLPPGLQIGNGVVQFETQGQADTGFLIFGVPTQAGVFNFSIEVTDAYNQLVQLPYTMTVDPFEVTPPYLQAGEVNVGYSTQLNVQGGVSPYTFTLVSGTLPAGITLSTSGLLQGTPVSSSAGSYPITIKVQDFNLLTETQSFVLKIFTGNTFAITTTGLGPATIGQNYSQSIAAQFGTPPYTYSLFAGSLPTGMSFTPLGLLTGLPAPGTAGSYPFVVLATDSNGQATTQAFTLVVEP